MKYSTYIVQKDTQKSQKTQKIIKMEKNNIMIKMNSVVALDLYTLAQITGGLDVYDKTFDFATFFTCDEKITDESDYYDKFIYLVGCNVDVTYYLPGKSTAECDLTRFMWENRDIFDEFLNEHYIEGYRPMDYESLDPDDDSDGFYEVYLDTIDKLFAGSFSENEYEILYKKFVEKAKKQQQKGGKRKMEQPVIAAGNEKSSISICDTKEILKLLKESEVKKC